MKIELEKHEQPDGKHQYVVFAGSSCKGIFIEDGADALTDTNGTVVAQLKAEALYEQLVSFYKNGPRKTTLKSTEI